MHEECEKNCQTAQLKGQIRLSANQKIAFLLYGHVDFQSLLPKPKF